MSKSNQNKKNDSKDKKNSKKDSAKKKLKKEKINYNEDILIFKNYNLNLKSHHSLNMVTFYYSNWVINLLITSLSLPSPVSSCVAAIISFISLSDGSHL